MSTQLSGDLSRRIAYDFFGERRGRSTSDLMAIQGQNFWEYLTGLRPEHETVKQLLHVGLIALGGVVAIKFSQR